MKNDKYNTSDLVSDSIQRMVDILDKMHPLISNLQRWEITKVNLSR